MTTIQDNPGMYHVICDHITWQSSSMSFGPPHPGTLRMPSIGVASRAVARRDPTGLPGAKWAENSTPSKFGDVDGKERKGRSSKWLVLPKH